MFNNIADEEEGGEGGEEGVAEEGKKKRKRNKKKKTGGGGGPVQTDPPSIPIKELYPNGAPEGQIMDHPIAADEYVFRLHTRYF